MVPVNYAEAVAALPELWALQPQALPGTAARERFDALLAAIRACGLALDNVYPPDASPLPLSNEIGPVDRQ